MMTQRDRKIAEELKTRLSEAVTLIDFKVFGSRARGDSEEYSDMDVFLEVESISKDLKEKISDIIWEVGFNNYLIISSLIFTREEIENSPLRASPILKNINSEGIRI
ncbi:MAG: nucleotidyltransferase domain-containing protein [Deltaproteobacteria bacterium]|nr:nucleotidyltransferase domain-containing protein [Deltaproteobacteria bacterium]